jgi:hypothetical protein
LAIANAREQGFAAGGLKGMYESELPVRKDLFSQGSGSAYELAETYAALGQKQDALANLQVAFDQREGELLTGDPAIPALSDDPSYRELRAKVRRASAR